jgi:hypothetical protein
MRKKYEGPMEEIRRVNLEASSYGTGTKEHFDTYGFCYIKGFQVDEPIDRANEKIRHVLWGKVDLQPRGDSKLLIQVEGTSKIYFKNFYVVLGQGDGFLYKKGFKLKHKKPWFSKCHVMEIEVFTNV